MKIFLCLLGIVIFAFTVATLKDGEQTYPSHHPFKSAELREEYIAFNNLQSKSWPVPYEIKEQGTSAGKTFIRICGSEKNPPLILLPPGGGNSLNWIPMVEELSQYFHVYALDNIHDFGRSIYYQPFETGEDFAVWLDELFTSLKLGDRVNIMGMSYGSWIASQFALFHPERIDRIVLLSPPATIIPIRLEFTLRALLSLVHKRLNKSFVYWIFEDFAKSSSDNHKVLDDIVEYTELCNRSFIPYKLVLPTVLTDDELRSIRVPTLYVVGENEKICSPSKAIKRLNKVAPQINTAVIPNAGHDLMLVDPDGVNEVVIAFLLKNEKS